MAFDSLFANVPLLCPFNGADNSTTIVDVKGHPLTASGGAKIVTAQSKWGGSSLYLPGAGASVAGLHSADNNIDGAVDFCIQGWLYLPTGSTGGRVIGCGSNWVGVNWGFTMTSTRAFQLNYGDTNSSSYSLTWGNVVPLNAWTFFKVSVTGTVAQSWQGGVSQGTGTVDNTLKPRLSRPGDFILIGKAHDGTLPFTGYLDDLRVTIGNSRVSDNTSVPTAAFPTTGFPVLATSFKARATSGFGFSSSRGHALITSFKARASSAFVMKLLLSGKLTTSFNAHATSVFGFSVSRGHALATDFKAHATSAFTLGVTHTHTLTTSLRAQATTAFSLVKTTSKAFNLFVNSRAVSTFNLYRTIAVPPSWVSRQYRCKSGADLTFPASSFTANLSASGGSFLSVQVPGSNELLSQIVTRKLGNLIVCRTYRYSDGSSVEKPFISVAYETLSVDENPKSGLMLTLNGRQYLAATSKKTVPLADATFRGFSGGSVRYRCPVNDELAIGDIALINGERFKVGGINYSVSDKQEMMEITEYQTNGIDLGPAIGSNARRVKLTEYAIGWRYDYKGVQVYSLWLDYWLNRFNFPPAGHQPDPPQFSIYYDSKGDLWYMNGYEGDSNLAVLEPDGVAQANINNR